MRSRHKASTRRSSSAGVAYLQAPCIRSLLLATRAVEEEVVSEYEVLRALYLLAGGEKLVLHSMMSQNREAQWSIPGLIGCEILDIIAR